MVHTETTQPKVSQRQDAQAFCDQAIDMFMRGSFAKFSRTLEDLDKIKTDNIKRIIEQEQRAMMGVTVEEE